MSFDLLAPHYRWMEFVLAGRKLQRCRTAFLRTVTVPKNVLICGEGNGRFLRAARAAWPEARITVLDLSRNMLLQAKRRGGAEKAEFVQANILEWQPPKQQFDLVATHFFLDCFRPEQLEIIVEKISQAATAQANWLLADFQAPARGIGRVRARIILRMMYTVFRLVTRLPASDIAPPNDYLTRNGFELHKQQVSEWGLLRTDWWRRASLNG
jgi:ubiquinone/menaquinone biosynthesis C-methylase UbiE